MILIFTSASHWVLHGLTSAIHQWVHCRVMLLISVSHLWDTIGCIGGLHLLTESRKTQREIWKVLSNPPPTLSPVSLHRWALPANRE